MAGRGGGGRARTGAEAARLTPRRRQTSAKSCDALLLAPKVALLFLTRGPMAHERTWSAWLAGAAGLVPLPAVARRGCGPEAVAALDAACGAAAGRRAAHKFGEDNGEDAAAAAAAGAAAARAPLAGRAALRAQHLFTIFVHAPPDFPGYAPDSLFAGRIIDTRIAPAWGSHDLVDATRALFKAALADAANERFVMLSESGVPTLPPQTVYMALLGSAKSRVNACVDDVSRGWESKCWGVAAGALVRQPFSPLSHARHPPTHLLSQSTDPWRWHPDMDPDGAPDGARVPFEAWRKSSQWSALVRAHAQVVADDTAIDAIFGTVCRSREWDEELEREYVCYSDEHYIPTLLSLRGLENQTDCLGYTVAVDWSLGGAHPRAYGAGDVSAGGMAGIRDAWGNCAALAANAAASSLVVPPATLTPASCATVGDAGLAGAWSDRLTPRECSLFARKFLPDAAAAVRSALADCRVGAILPCVPAEAEATEGGD